MPRSAKATYTVPRLKYSHERSGASDQTIEIAFQRTNQASSAKNATPDPSSRGNGSRPRSTSVSAPATAQTARAPIQTSGVYDDPSPKNTARAERASTVTSRAPALRGRPRGIVAEAN